jgi:transcriptional regulator with GAF, ATPase, and Fis domain
MVGRKIREETMKDTPDESELRRRAILRVLEQTRWKISGNNSASEILGLDRSTLRARMQKLNIRKP